MPVIRQIALNGNGGAFVDVYATMPCRAFKFMEDEGAAVQGVQAKFLTDKFVATETYSFASQQADQGIQIPDLHAYSPNGPLLGLPAQGAAGAFNYTAATKLASFRSNTATATMIRFTEYE